MGSLKKLRTNTFRATTALVASSLLLANCGRSSTPSAQAEIRVRTEQVATFLEARRLEPKNGSIEESEQEAQKFLKKYSLKELDEIKTQMDKEINYRDPSKTPAYYKDPAWDAYQVWKARQTSLANQNWQNFELIEGAIFAGVSAIVVFLVFVS